MPGGRACIQAITIDEAAFERYRRTSDFIREYIFPGGMLAPVERLSKEARAAGLAAHEPFRFGLHYAETLRRWRERVEARAGEIRALGFDDKFLALWRFYLCYCEVGFDRRADRRRAPRGREAGVSRALLAARPSPRRRALAQGVPPLPAPVVSDAPAFRALGEGRLRWFGLHVYDSTLWVPGDAWSADRPFALDIRYAMGIKGRDLTERSLDGDERLGYTDAGKLGRWEARDGPRLPRHQARRPAGGREPSRPGSALLQPGPLPRRGGRPGVRARLLRDLARPGHVRAEAARADAAPRALAVAATGHSSARLAAYGFLGLPLAMAALPIYVHVPKFYADTLGLSLAGVGCDPAGGARPRRRAGSAPRMVERPQALPAAAPAGPSSAPACRSSSSGWRALQSAFAGPGALERWLVANLMVVYTAFSLVTVSYQAHGAEISDDIAERTRVTAWREGFALVGVFLAAALPEILKASAGEREGFARFSLVFAPLAIVAAAVTVRGSPPAHARVPPAGAAFAAFALPFRNARFRRLLAVFVLNGIAAAIPATLVLFFIEDVVRRPDLAAAFLVAYFAAGAPGCRCGPGFRGASARGGPGSSAMILSIAAFVWAFFLGPGSVAAYLAICVMSGVGLGADLALPPSLLADVIDVDEREGRGRNEGAYFGLWSLVTKLNLALAAGIALPLLQGFGYAPRADNVAAVPLRAGGRVRAAAVPAEGDGGGGARARRSSAARSRAGTPMNTDESLDR